MKGNLFIKTTTTANDQTKLKNKIYDNFIYLLRCIFHIFLYFSDECLSSSSPKIVHQHIYSFGTEREREREK